MLDRLVVRYPDSVDGQSMGYVVLPKDFQETHRYTPQAGDLYIQGIGFLGEQLVLRALETEPNHLGGVDVICMERDAVPFKRAWPHELSSWMLGDEMAHATTKHPVEIARDIVARRGAYINGWRFAAA